MALLFIPARSYLYHRNPEYKNSAKAPSWLVWLWLGGPIACFYGFAVHPYLGASLTVVFVGTVIGLSIYERARMSKDDKQRLLKAMVEQNNKPLPRIVRIIVYALLAYGVVSFLFERFGLGNAG